LAAAAPHFAAAADPGDPEAVDVLVRAVRRAEEREAYQEALGLLATLVNLLPAGDPRWRDVVSALSWDAQWVVDHRADAQAVRGIDALRRIDAVLAPLDAPAERAVVKFRLASFLAWGQGELGQAERECARAGELFTVAGDRRSAWLAEHELAWIRALRGDLPGLGVAAERIVERARSTGDHALRLRATRSLILVEQNAGRFVEGEARVAETIALARATGDGYAEALGLHCRAIGLCFQGRSEEALAVLSSAAGLDPERADPIGLNSESMAYWCAGDFAAAVSHGLAALAGAPGPVSRRRGLPLFFTTLAAVENGRYDVAADLVERARQTYQDRDWFVYSHWMTHAGAFLRWRAEGGVEPLATMRRTSDRLRAMGCAVGAAVALFDVAEVASELGDLPAGSAAADALGEIAAELDGDFYRGLARTAGALVALGAGDAPAAAARARDAVEALDGLPCRAHRGRATLVYGRALATTDPDRAVAALRSAGEAFAACAAPWRQRRALAELAALGAPGRRAAAALQGPTSLTRREREVARLAAEGHSSREIGARLAISTRTVESHLGRIYAKLGVNSKLCLAARADELRL
jgi:DNA-binding CsgD family transcriptional regulator